MPQNNKKLVPSKIKGKRAQQAKERGGKKCKKKKRRIVSRFQEF